MKAYYTTENNTNNIVRRVEGEVQQQVDEQMVRLAQQNRSVLVQDIHDQQKEELGPCDPGKATFAAPPLAGPTIHSELRLKVAESPSRQQRAPPEILLSPILWNTAVVERKAPARVGPRASRNFRSHWDGKKSLKHSDRGK